MSSFCVDKGVIGTEKHFCFDGNSYSWCDDQPDDCYIFRYQQNQNDEWCLNTLFKLNGITINHSLPSEQILPWKVMLKNDFVYEKIRWQYVLKPKEYKTFFVNLINDIKIQIDKSDDSYHQNYFLLQSQLFNEFEQVNVDVLKLDSYKNNELNPSNKSVLESFRPIISSLAKKPIYNRFGSRTGRLTIESGPEILTLKRSYRDLMVSSYQGGKIFYADYSALEARTFLSIVEKIVLTKDVYTELSERFLKSKYDRNIVKQCVLAILFGSTNEAIQNVLKTNKQETDEFVNKLKEQFEYDSLRKRLYDEWNLGGKKIKNFYGRVIDVPEESTLINSYIQSTGVDVALLGFLNIVKLIQKKQFKISPLFVLHDALILDVHPQHFDQLNTIARFGQSISRMKNQFFIDVKPLIVEQTD